MNTHASSCAAAFLLATTLSCQTFAQTSDARAETPFWNLLTRETPAERAVRQWDSLVSVDGATCRAALRATGARFRALPDRPTPDARGCGIPHGVVLTRGPTGITYANGLVIDCSFALQLPEIERVVQEEARAHLGGEVRRVATFGSYNCRPVRGGRGYLSEHALGNAVDLARFETARHNAALVVRDFRAEGDPRANERSVFLRNVYDRLRGLEGVARVRGPEDDALHHDHFHVDRGVRWWRW